VQCVATVGHCNTLQQWALQHTATVQTATHPSADVTKAVESEPEILQRGVVAQTFRQLTRALCTH